MKKTIVILSLCFTSLEATHNIKSSHTFLFTRPAQQNLALKLALWHNLLFDKQKETAVQVAAFYQNSYKANEISQYFLPFNTPSPLVSATALDTNILPDRLSLPQNFSGYINIAPQQKQAGCTLEVRRNLGKLIDVGTFFGKNFLEDWALLASITFLDMQNNINLTQSDVQNPGPTTSPVYDIITAFNNPAWQYDKINGKQSVKGISEIRLGVATTLLASRRAVVATYTEILFPTTKNYNNTYLFGPQLGYCQHVGFIWGICFQVPLNRADEDYRVSWALNFENIFLIRNHQYRTFDLISKQTFPYGTPTNQISGQWSRFLPMRKQYQTIDETVPGVNVLTHKVRVSPYNIMDFSTGLRYAVSVFELELGYALWAHGSERIKFTHPVWIPEYGVAGSTTNTTASKSTASYQAPDDATFTPIQESDIDYDSGATTSGLAQKAYLALGSQYVGEKIDAHFSLGSFIEIPQNKTATLALWGIWVSGGLAF